MLFPAGKVEGKGRQRDRSVLVFDAADLNGLLRGNMVHKISKFFSDYTFSACASIRSRAA